MGLPSNSMWIPAASPMRLRLSHAGAMRLRLQACRFGSFVVHLGRQIAGSDPQLKARPSCGSCQQHGRGELQHGDAYQPTYMQTQARETIRAMSKYARTGAHVDTLFTKQSAQPSVHLVHIKIPTFADTNRRDRLIVHVLCVRAQEIWFHLHNLPLTPKSAALRRVQYSARCCIIGPPPPD